jgi:hypothetical protein
MGRSIAGSLFVPEILIRALLEPADVTLDRGGEAAIFGGKAHDRCRVARTLGAQRLDHMVLLSVAMGSEVNAYGTALKPWAPRQICAVRDNTPFWFAGVVTPVENRSAIALF